MKRGTFAIIFLALVSALYGPAIGQQRPANSKKGIIIRAPKPYDNIKTAVRNLGGDITYEYENIDAVAARVPEDKLTALTSSVDAAGLYKDVTVRVPETVVPASATLKKGVTIARLNSRGAVALNGDDIARLSPNPAHKDGNRGRSVVVAVIDTGVANAPQVNALEGSIIGGETFVTGDPAGSPTSTRNDPHGTQVASVLAAHAGFIFANDSVLVQSYKANDPSSVISCPNNRFPSCVAGQSVIPMIGAAPEARIYAIKVFDSLGGGATKSRVIAAMDRLITLKRNFDRGRPSVPVNTPCGSEDNPCRFDSLPVQVVNMSLGGPTLFAGNDVEDEMTEQLLKAGITPVVSAGNEGMAAMTGNSPGTGKGSVTVGAASLAVRERIIRDLELGLGQGMLFRAARHDQTAWFSSRGPTADGRIDPDVVANGVGNYTQAADGSITFVEGTSFASPAVSGAAAVVIGALRAGSFTATEIRNALIDTADGTALGDGSGAIDQGNGFVDVNAALRLVRSGRASSRLPDSHPEETVAANIQSLGFRPIQFDNNIFSTHVRNLRPGQVAHFFVPTKEEVNRLTVKLLNITPELPPQRQNQLFGDDTFLRVADAPTSFFRGRVDEFVGSDSQFIIDEPQTGLIRLALQGDWTNAGRISADVVIERQKRPLLPETADGTVSSKQQSVQIPVNMPSGKSNAIFETFWDNDWSAYPTNDLDMILCPPGVPLGPSCNFAGATLASPERVVIDNPAPGTWNVFVVGFTLNTHKDKFKLRVSADGERLRR